MAGGTDWMGGDSVRLVRRSRPLEFLPVTIGESDKKAGYLFLGNFFYCFPTGASQSQNGHNNSVTQYITITGIIFFLECMCHNWGLLDSGTVKGGNILEAKSYHSLCKELEQNRKSARE